MSDAESDAVALPKSGEAQTATQAAKPETTTATAKVPAAKPGRETASEDGGKPGAPARDKLRRRLIWTAIWGYLTANFLMFLRFFFPRVLFEPDTVHNMGYPADFQIGVDEKYKQAYRIWVVKEPPRLFCIFAKCTHLGCTPDWKPAEEQIQVPVSWQRVHAGGNQL